MPRHLRRRPRAHRNPLGGSIAWGWLGLGAAVGAAVAVGAGYLVQSSQHLAAPTPGTSLVNASTGAGIGAVIAAAVRGLTKRHSGATVAAGALGGAALIGGAFLLSKTPTTPALPASTTPATA